MISADFYPTAIQFDAPSYAPTFHLTDKVMDCDPDAFSNYYWLGWLSWDNFPDCWKLSGYTLTNTELIFNIATQPQNINIGYASKYGGTSGGNNIYPECYHESPLVNIGSPSARYINKLDVMGVGNSGVVFGWHCTYIYGAGDSLTNRGYNDGSFRLSGKSLYDFLYGDATQTIQLATGISYELDFDNMEEDGSFHFTTTYNDNNFDFVVSFSYCAPLNMRNVSSTATAGTQNVNAYPMYSLIMDGDIYSFMATDAAFYHPSGYPCCIVNKSTQQPTASASAGNIIGDYIANGLECTIPKAFITSSPSYSRLITGNAHVFNRGSDVAVYRMLTRSEMQKIVGLSLRQSDGTYNTYGYQNELSYAPYITEDNEFTATLITGDLSDDEFKAKLRPWQYDVDEWAENDYTEDDLPPYDPGGDGDDQGSNTGSVIRPTTLGVGGTNGFITQYSLTAAQIAEIGRLLWLSFTDPDYYKNFLFTLTTTGTLNLSNLLDYFVSLRVYPFPLINVPSHAAAGQDMWIGAGLVPLSFNTNLHTINNYADYIDAGSCTIPRYYNDFRDFAHTQIMLYLPYCGTVQLNPADVVGSTLHAQYAVDFATGGVTAYVDCTTWDGSQFVIAVLTGSIGADIPLTASNAAQIAARIAGDALNFAGTVGEAISSDVGRSAQAIGSAATGDVVGAAIGVANTYAGRIGGALDVAQTGLQIATAEGVKMPMLSGGRGFGSFGAPQTAYVQIRRGIYAEGQQPAQGFKEAYGEAYAKPVQVSLCAGFTVFANVDTSGLKCDAMEREQVKKMMQAGIYI